MAVIDDGADADPRHLPPERWTRSPTSVRRRCRARHRSRRQVRPETTARPAARWWAAAATFIALVTLQGALGYGPLVTVVVAPRS
jgi:hypothetical protein